eukprot:TRINITY_DN10064_c0_g1_i1.p1 TRINITY_DN10064_c0_g1~~TRINITY_DN10064_c0_g1_i1.p1  ORF type:complete len:381 (-),score=71.70 TRINITY_DN10064_c0_g1_i1:107-1249(-)
MCIRDRSPTDLYDWVFLKDSLTNREGVLQKFIPSRGECNDALQVTWSPHLCTMTRRANVHRIDSRHVPPRDRACTFDGPPHLSIETKGNATVRETINGLLKRVSTHLLESEHRIVSRFVGLFKHDANGNLWMLHMSSVRIQNVNLLEFNARSPVEITPKYIQPDSPCSNEMIDRVSKLRVTLDGPSVFRDRRVYVRPNASVLHQQSTPLPTKDKDLVLHKASLTTRNQGGRMPPEYAQLTQFIDDTLYELYSTRMTKMGGGPRGTGAANTTTTQSSIGGGDHHTMTSGGGSKAGMGATMAVVPDKPVVVRLSRALQEFLGDLRVEGLVVYILKLEPVAVAEDGAIMFHSTTPSQQRTLAEVREECDLLLQEVERSIECNH